MAEGETYTIHIDGRWSLEDLYTFSRTYEQVYFILPALLPGLDEWDNERIFRAFQAYPWRGGYSAVNFYNQLKYNTPREQRPSVASIQYASPGWIEIGTVLIPLTYVLAHVVNRVTKTLNECNQTYSSIYREAQQRKLLSIEIERKRLELEREQLEFAIEACEKLSRMMDLPDPATIHTRTDNPLISLKILLSIYRRVRTLAIYQQRGKAEFNDKR